LRHLEEAQREAPDDPQILAEVARLYSSQGAPPEFQAKAQAIWSRVAALNPQDRQARLRITVGPLLSGERSKAEVEKILETLEGMIRADPDFDPARVRFFRALALERLGRTDEAYRAFREVTLLAGVSPFRKRSDDAELDAAIDALRALEAETRKSGGTDSSPSRESGR
jgi:tetratricopeptide (TPR) repeat protein